MVPGIGLQLIVDFRERHCHGNEETVVDCQDNNDKVPLELQGLIVLNRLHDPLHTPHLTLLDRTA